MWDKYREIDLAPMDPIIDDGSDVDSIMGTPVRKTTDVAENSETDDRTRAVSIRPKTRDLPGDGKSNEQASAPLGLNAKVIEGYANETGPMYLVDIPGHFGDAFHLRFRTRASAELIAVFLRKRGEALDASKDDIDRLVEVRFHSHGCNEMLTRPCRASVNSQVGSRFGIPLAQRRPPVKMGTMTRR